MFLTFFPFSPRGRFIWNVGYSEREIALTMPGTSCVFRTLSRLPPCEHPALLRTPRSITDTPLYYGHPALLRTPRSITDTPLYYGHPALLWTPRSITDTPLYYGHPALLRTPASRDCRNYNVSKLVPLLRTSAKIIKLKLNVTFMC